MSVINSISMLAGASVPTETVVIPGASDWTAVGSGLTFGTGTFDATAEACARTVAEFDGDFTLTATINSETNWNFGCFAASEYTSFNSATGNGLRSGMSVSYSYNGGDDSLFYGNARQGADGAGGGWSSGDVVTIKRIGTTVTFMKKPSGGSNANLLEFSQPASVALMIMFGAGGTTDINDIQWVV